MSIDFSVPRSPKLLLYSPTGDWRNHFADVTFSAPLPVQESAVRSLRKRGS